MILKWLTTYFSNYKKKIKNQDIINLNSMQVEGGNTMSVVQDSTGNKYIIFQSNDKCLQSIK